MGTEIKGVRITPLRQIMTEKGDVYHALKSSEADFSLFGEAYFSFVKKGYVKGWKKHQKMQLNLIVPVGSIKFVIYDDRPDSDTCGSFKQIVLSASGNYARLSIDPGLWLAFQGLDETNCLLNIASLEHNPEESKQVVIDEFKYEWQ